MGELFDLPLSYVQVIGPDPGGGFGGINPRRVSIPIWFLAGAVGGLGGCCSGFPRWSRR